MMKKIFFLIFAISTVACQKDAKDYVTFSGEIIDKNSDSIVIRTRGFSKTMKVMDDGTFGDTLKVKTGIYNFYDGGESTNIFLKNGFDIKMTLDTKMFDETAKYLGTGSENSNFLAEKSLLEEKLMDKSFATLDEQGLENAFAEIETEIVKFINSAKGLDTMVTSMSLRNVDGLIKGNKGYFAGILEMKKALPKGSPSPTFEGFENYKGGETSINDLKGKYAYIDIWATWCGPCKAEIPSLKELEKDYHGKNIQFVSMSIDDDRSHQGSWDLAKQNWKAMVADKELGGIQIFAPNGWKTEFIEDYKIKGIPRFILIDPNGNIVDASAPRPSDPALRVMFDALVM
ncbi:MAG: thiol-disulfide isomerase/thioredoxin [Sediminicola sp.]|jgi:thiol-disulfide isomerase/thioredoxin